jgi:hypothetical protein
MEFDLNARQLQLIQQALNKALNDTSMSFSDIKEIEDFQKALRNCKKVGTTLHVNFT